MRKRSSEREAERGGERDNRIHRHTDGQTDRQIEIHRDADRQKTWREADEEIRSRDWLYLVSR